MSDPNAPAAPTHIFAPPAEMPPMSDAVADRMSRYSGVANLSDPAQALSIEQLAKHQLDMEAKIALEHPEGLNNLAPDFRNAQEANNLDAKLAPVLDQVLQPPPDAGHYVMPWAGDTPEEQQDVAELREAMFVDGKMPAREANTILDSLYQQSLRLRQMDPFHVTSHIEEQGKSTDAMMRASWGSDYDKVRPNMEAHLNQMTRRNPAVRPVILADPNAVNALMSLARIRIGFR